MNLVKLTCLTILAVILLGCAKSETGIETQTSIVSNTEESPNDNEAYIVTATSEILNLPKEENDGRLSLNINLQDNKKDCYSPEEPISIILEYRNLTASAFRIVDYDAISIHALTGAKAQVYPTIYDKNGQEVFTPEHLRLSQYGYFKETKIHSLGPNGVLNVLSNTYVFPRIIISKNMASENQKIPTPSGTYYLQFKYVNIGETEYWEGVISSNVIDVCIE